MANVGFATLSVIPSFNGFQSRLERGVNPGLTRAGTLGGARFGDAAGRSAGQRFGSTFRTAARAGILGGLALAAGAIKIGSDSIGEAREAQKIGRLTAAVIKSTGGAARVTERQVGKLANRLGFMAGVDDEIVQGGANVLLTFKNIRNEAGKGNKIFDRTTEATVNLSAALDKDLKSSAIQVGKALNDPVAGMTALSRAGVQFTEQQKDQVKALIASGDQLGAQKIILSELESEFGGAARSQASATDRLKVAFGNVEERLGQGLLPLVQKFSRFLLRDGVPAAEEFADWFTEEGVPAMEDLGHELRPLVRELLPAAADGFKAIKGFAEDALPVAEGVAGAFNDLPGWVKKVLIGGTLGTTFALKLGAGSLAKAIGGSLFSRGSSPANPLWVQSVTGGTGGIPGADIPGDEKVPSRLKRLAGNAARGGILLAAVPVTIESLKIDEKNLTEGIRGAILGGGRGTPTGGAGSDVVTPSWIEQYGKLNDELDDTHNHLIANKQAVEEFGGSIRERIPRTIPFDMPGIRNSEKDARALIAALLEARSLHFAIDGEGLGGGNTTPPNRSGGGGVDLQPSTRGVTITVEKVEAQDVNGLLRDLQGRAHRAGSDGIRR